MRELLLLSEARDWPVWKRPGRFCGDLVLSRGAAVADGFGTMNELDDPNTGKGHTPKEFNEISSASQAAGNVEGADPESEAVDQQETELASKLKPLVFSSTVNKGVPSELIALDRALDRLGREKYPKEWGLSEHWHLMPFLRRANGYCQRTIEGSGADRIMRYVPFERDMPADELKQCARMYREVCRAMVNYLQSGPEKAAVMNVDGDIFPVKHEQRGLWNNRRKAIFYTGYVHYGEGKQLHRVLVDEGAFEDHMSLPPELRVLARDEVLLARIRTVIQRWGRRREVSITRDRLDQVILPMLKKLQLERLDNRIETFVWERLTVTVRQGRGQPKTKDTQAFEADKENLKKQLMAELVRP